MKSLDRYSAVAILLHWAIALLLIGQLAAGFYMHRLMHAEPNPDQQLTFQLLQWHKSFGVTIFFLTLIRLGWRLTHRPPPLPAEMPGWEKFAARSVHAGFYVLLLAMPLVGWAIVSSSPFAESVQTYLFGVVHWPHLPFFEGIENRKEVSHQFAELHEALAFIMIGLIVLHVAAALKHQFINRDGVLGHMLPFARKRA